MYISLDEFYKLCGIHASIHNSGEITEEEVSCLGDIIKNIEDRRRVKNKKNRENMRRVRNSNAVDEEVEDITEVTKEEKVEVAEEVINPEDELSESDVDLLDFLDSII